MYHTFIYMRSCTNSQTCLVVTPLITRSTDKNLNHAPAPVRSLSRPSRISSKCRHPYKPMRNLNKLGNKAVRVMEIARNGITNHHSIRCEILRSNREIFAFKYHRQFPSPSIKSDPSGSLSIKNSHPKPSYSQYS